MKKSSLQIAASNLQINTNHPPKETVPNRPNTSSEEEILLMSQRIKDSLTGNTAWYDKVLEIVPQMDSENLKKFYLSALLLCPFFNTQKHQKLLTLLFQPSIEKVFYFAKPSVASPVSTVGSVPSTPIFERNSFNQKSFSAIFSGIFPNREDINSISTGEAYITLILHLVNERPTEYMYSVCHLIVKNLLPCTDTAILDTLEKGFHERKAHLIPDPQKTKKQTPSPSQNNLGSKKHDFEVSNKLSTIDDNFISSLQIENQSEFDAKQNFFVQYFHVLEERKYLYMHKLLKSMAHIMPSCAPILLKCMKNMFPNTPSDSILVHSDFVFNLCRIMEYAPVLRHQILNLLLREAVNLDIRVSSSGTFTEQLDKKNKSQFMDWKDKDSKKKKKKKTKKGKRQQKFNHREIDDDDGDENMKDKVQERRNAYFAAAKDTKIQKTKSKLAIVPSKQTESKYMWNTVQNNGKETFSSDSSVSSSDCDTSSEEDSDDETNSHGRNIDGATRLFHESDKSDSDGDAQNDDDDTLFAMDGFEVQKGIPRTPTDDAKGPHQSPENNSNKNSASSSSASTTATIEEERKMKEKLDNHVDFLLQYLSKYAPNSGSRSEKSNESQTRKIQWSVPSHPSSTPSNAPKEDIDTVRNEIFSMMLDFMKSILHSNQKTYCVQYLMFYICSFKESYSNSFIEFLLKSLFDSATNSEVRELCSLYVASFVSRSQYVSPFSLHTTLRHLSKWIVGYMEYFENLCKEQSKKKGGGTKPNTSLEAHKMFFSIVQCIVLILCFKISILMEEEKDLDFRTQILNPLLTVLNSPLRPLEIIPKSITKQFLKIFNFFDIDLGSVIESHRKGIKDSFFSRKMLVYTFDPFGPFLLKKSKELVENLYQKWKDVTKKPKRRHNIGINAANSNNDDDSSFSEAENQKIGMLISESLSNSFQETFLTLGLNMERGKEIGPGSQSSNPEDSDLEDKNDFAFLGEEYKLSIFRSNEQSIHEYENEMDVENEANMWDDLYDN